MDPAKYPRNMDPTIYPRNMDNQKQLNFTFPCELEPSTEDNILFFQVIALDFVSKMFFNAGFLRGDIGLSISNTAAVLESDSNINGCLANVG